MGSLEDEGVLNEAKRPNMAENREKATPDQPPPEPSRAELKAILADIQVKVTFIRAKCRSERVCISSGLEAVHGRNQ